VNLPNALTVARIVAAPAVAWLPFVPSWQARLLGFVLFVVVAVTDYYDGKLARERGLVTNLGKLLDPLADKLLLLATFVPMYLLQRPGGVWPEVAATLGVPVPLVGVGGQFPFVLPGRVVPLPFWVVAVILGRELFMTVFRQLAARRGVIIAAIGPAKWKTGFQWTWVGTAYFWFAAATAAERYGWARGSAGALWRAFAYFNGLAGAVTMYVAVALTLYSLWLYLRRFGAILRGA
jgi:phosphatidylglycerophosphate synthase